MKRNPRIGAACGRIHPTGPEYSAARTNFFHPGSGFMQSYQKFEYAIGHWLQKATEHMLGCVLCRWVRWIRNDVTLAVRDASPSSGLLQ